MMIQCCLVLVLDTVEKYVAARGVSIQRTGCGSMHSPPAAALPVSPTRVALVEHLPRPEASTAFLHQEPATAPDE